MGYKSVACRASGFESASDQRPETDDRLAYELIRRLIVSFFLISLILQAYSVRAQEKIRIAPSSPVLAAWPVHLAANFSTDRAQPYCRAEQDENNGKAIRGGGLYLRQADFAGNRCDSRDVSNRTV